VIVKSNILNTLLIQQSADKLIKYNEMGISLYSGSDFPPRV